MTLLALEPDIDSAIYKVEAKYNGWILGSIKQTFRATEHAENGSTPLSAFILISCALDFFAGFYNGITDFDPNKSGQKYKAFVSKYMPQYEANDICKHLRCRLAHNYTIGGNIGLIHHHQKEHDPMGSNGHKIINFENFLEDFDQAIINYFRDLRDTEKIAIRRNFIKRYNLGFADVFELVR
jgi:hypothetical protein